MRATQEPVRTGERGRAPYARPMARRPVPVSTLHSPGAMVASADHLATAAGLRVLANHGSAADAAIAANAVLAVTAPHLCGMGGDLFALVHAPGMEVPAVLNASGRAGSGADPDKLRARGLVAMPYRHDVASVTVPGCVDGWLALHGRFGQLPLDALLADAIRLAEHGFPASPLLVAALEHWKDAPIDFRNVARPGQRVVRPGAARALRAIVASGRDGFYGGEFGDGLLALGHGEFQAIDLERPGADWVAPLRTDAWDARLWTVPPNSQGYLTLASSWVAARLALPYDETDPRWPHLLIEATGAVGHDRPDFLYDGADADGFLQPDHLASRLATVDEERASTRWPPARDGDTTYLCAIDAGGMGVSLIQSNAAGFGSWLVEPNTSINLHNRGLAFSLTPGHRAEYGPGRRPPHTLCPALATRPDGRLLALVGTQGGDAQPQIILQLLSRLLGNGRSPADAMNAARWILEGEGRGFDTWKRERRPTVSIEDGAPPSWAPDLARRGHRVTTGPSFDSRYGHAQLIVVGDDGIRAGATDGRARIGAVLGA